jgi:hypothetical protein
MQDHVSKKMLRKFPNDTFNYRSPQQVGVCCTRRRSEVDLV